MKFITVFELRNKSTQIVAEIGSNIEKVIITKKVITLTRLLKEVLEQPIKEQVSEIFSSIILRYTFASHLVMTGIASTTFKELLGHKTLTMNLPICLPCSLSEG